MDIGLCVLGYHTRDRENDLLRALDSMFCDIVHETGKMSCHGYWNSVFCDHARDNGYDWLRALDSASCDIIHETGEMIYYGYWVLCLLITYTRQLERFITGIGFYIS